MKGFYETLSVFTMEALPNLVKVGAEKVGDNFPRIMNWNMGNRTAYGKLMANVFKQVNSYFLT